METRSGADKSRRAKEEQQGKEERRAEEEKKQANRKREQEKRRKEQQGRGAKEKSRADKKGQEETGVNRHGLLSHGSWADTPQDACMSAGELAGQGERQDGHIR